MRCDPKELAIAIRRTVLKMTSKGQASHVGSCLSVADILAVLYGEVLNIDPKRVDWPERDRMIVSKGHAAAAVYAVLAELDYFPSNWLLNYGNPGSPLLGHVSHTIAGIELSTGSLGHGLPIAAGLSLAAKRSGQEWRSFVVLSDGELNEGSNWEAALFAAHHGLDNLIAIVDYNKLQGFGRTGEVLELEPLADKWQAFGWETLEVDGNDVEDLTKVFSNIRPFTNRPTSIIAHTVKGKGVSFMENRLEWHYMTPNEEQLCDALTELDKKV